jgi:hypothetical protein
MKWYFYIIFIILAIVGYFQFKQNSLQNTFENLSDTISNTVSSSGTPFSNSFPVIKK